MYWTFLAFSVAWTFNLVHVIVTELVKKLLYTSTDLCFLLLSSNFVCLVCVAGSRTPSPVSNQSKSGSDSPSPIPALRGTDTHKDSPTPDRDSLHIDIVGPDDVNVNRGKLAFVCLLTCMRVHFWCDIHHIIHQMLIDQ